MSMTAFTANDSTYAKTKRRVLCFQASVVVAMNSKASRMTTRASELM